jgi:hypothetical protein
MTTSTHTAALAAVPVRGATLRRYPLVVPARIVLTAEEWLERMNHAAPPTADDVGILWDGRRLDSREAVMAWLAEVAAQRADEAALGVNADR